MSTTVNAIRFRQGVHVLYCFTIDGKSLSDITTVPTLTRDENGISGYQRAEVTEHIRNIRNYLDGKNPMLPTGIVVAFDGRSPRFKPLEPGSDFGQLTITKPALLVDGNQRASSLRDSSLPEGQFPVAVIAFVAETEAEQREMFVRTNMSKPLPKSLLMELLPTIEGPISTAMDRKRLPSMLTDRLNNDEDSPFRGLIKTASNTGGWVTDGTIIRLMETNFENDLFVSLREQGDIEEMLRIVKVYWTGVSTVFDDAWKKPGKDSRLLMSAGVISLGGFMNMLLDSPDFGKPTKAGFARALEVIEPVCRWTPTDKMWELGPDGGKRRYDEIENTVRGITSLTSYLCRYYRNTLKQATASSMHVA